MATASKYGETVTIEIMQGGFVLTYPSVEADCLVTVREVFASPRKLHQKLKSIFEAFDTGTENDN